MSENETTITKDDIVEWLKATAAVLEENAHYLSELDAPIGDADHGINMNRGFKKVMSKLPNVEDKDIGTILRTTGMALISSVGGAGGPLYGTLYLEAGKAVRGKTELSANDLVNLIEASLKGIVKLGKANIGDKTMVDAITPAVEALRQSVNNGNSLIEALHSMTDAAQKGMKDTIPMLAKKGRASYLGERSIGHQDPGATSSYLVLKTLSETIESRHASK